MGKAWEQLSLADSPFPRQGFSLSQTRQLIFVAGFAA